MNKNQKIVIGVSVGIGVLLAAGITAYIISQSKGSSNTNIDTNSNNLPSPENNTDTPTQIDTMSPNPVFNRNGELINDRKIMVGKMLFPKGASANVRTEPQVNDGLWNNKITTISGTNTPIGTVIGETLGGEDPAMRWFKVKLESAAYFFWTEGYVRADVVTFK
jgi:hypothetical protein